MDLERDRGLIIKAHAMLINAKTGEGVPDVLEAIVKRTHPPKGDPDHRLQALLFDSWFDAYRGVIVLVRVFEGTLRKGQKIRLWSNGRVFDVDALGVLTPKPVEIGELRAGEVGFLIANIKNVADTKIGDTIVDDANPAIEPLPGFEDIKPMVFAGLYTVDAHEHTQLREALDKLRLNDSSFFFEPESSVALGFGFRCGFLGLLHMEIIQERLEREFALELISTTPTVVYKIRTTKGETLYIDNPTKLPEPTSIQDFEEPYIKATLITPEAYVGNLLALCQERRGTQKGLTYLNPTRVMLIYEMPLSEIVLDFYDRLKSKTQGYASLDYEVIGYQPAELVKVDILLNGESVGALSFIVHRDKAAVRGRQVAEKMKEYIPRQMFEVSIQAAIGNKILARETVGALKKNVTAKCYGGDITRKRKLWEKQKEGKKRMKQVGRVEVPQEAFLALLKVTD